MKISFSVAGRVKGKSRPRFARMGQFVKTYSAENDILYENLVKMQFMDAVGERDEIPKESLVSVRIVAYNKLAKSAKKAVREAVGNGGLVFCPKKPDADNIVKIVCDALNGLAYDDDKQVVSVWCQKVWHSSFEGVTVSIEYLT